MMSEGQGTAGVKFLNKKSMSSQADGTTTSKKKKQLGVSVKMKVQKCGW